MSDDWREKNEEVAASFRESARREGRGYRVVCPFCTSSKTGRADYSLSVTGSGLWHCHRCEEGGKLQDPPDGSEADVDEERETPEIEPPEGYVPLGLEPGLSAESLEAARAYAAKRYLTPDLCCVLQVGACIDGYYSGRIVVPVLDGEQEWLGYVTRDWTGHAAKPYLYSRGLDRSRLWNHAALEQDDGAPVLVVEGVLDAVPYWPDAVATLGKLTHAQSASLRATSRSVVFVPDGDAWMDGRAAAMELRLRGKTAGWVKLPPRIDPDQVDREWLRAAARESLEAAL